MMKKVVFVWVGVYLLSEVKHSLTSVFDLCVTAVETSLLEHQLTSTKCCQIQIRFQIM